MSNVTRSGCGEGPDNIDIKVWARLGRDLGYELSAMDLENVYKEFLKVADKKKTVQDEDLMKIVDNLEEQPALSA